MTKTFCTKAERRMGMEVKEIVSLLDASVLLGGEHMSREVEGACGSDLMSDVLAFVKENTALITGLTNPHVIRTAQMLDINCVIFTRGKVPGDDILEKAKELDLVVLSTGKTTYVACGILYKSGLPGAERKQPG